MSEGPLIRYRTVVSDSQRWEGFQLRPDDIIITTPPKCGTTWTQMICALLILETPELPAPISELSPWLDQVTRSRRETAALLEAQSHRRFIKTHTPLDGLPRAEGVTYVCVGRDPRDVALSMDHHMANMRMDSFVAARDAAAAADGIEVTPGVTPPPRPDDERERFWAWVDNDTPPTDTGSTLLRTVRHLESFWDAKDVDVVMLHFDDLKEDLEGQMRALAVRLGIAVPDARWPRLVEAATFESMRSRADRTVPNSGKGYWRDEQQFFHRGTSGQWRQLLGPDDLARYRRRIDELTAPDLAAWLHRDSADT